MYRIGFIVPYSRIHVPWPEIPYWSHRPQNVWNASPLHKILLRAVYPCCILLLPASESRTPFPSPVPAVPETWQLWADELTAIPSLELLWCEQKREGGVGRWWRWLLKGDEINICNTFEREAAATSSIGAVMVVSSCGGELFLDKWIYKIEAQRSH